MEWIKQSNLGQDTFNEILSYDEYCKYFQDHPHHQLRPSCLYLKDMFNFFESEQDGSFTLFRTDSKNSPAVFGQSKTQQAIYQNLINFLEEGFNNKFILLVGPNGSSKSSIIRKIMEAAEYYSEKDEGKLFSFSWVFPIESYIKGSLGLGSNVYEGQIQSFAHLEDKDISSILPSDLKDHPILLIPKKTRQALIEEVLANNLPHLEIVRKSYLYHGDISKRNRMIFDALLKSYAGDFSKVMKHIRVERFTISKRYSIGAVTIEPQLHVDAKMQQISMDRRLSSLPPSLQSLNLFSMHGEMIMANRGIIEFSDLLKRPLDAFKYLLMTMETKNINIQGILTELDIFFIGSSNEIHLSAFKQHPDFNSFKGRINFVRVPYLLNAKDEEAIYIEQIKNIKRKARFEPHALETLCLWAAMSRLRPPQIKHYREKKLGEIAITLDPLEKVLLYTRQWIPERFDSEEKQILRTSIDQVEMEYENDTLYEGKFGISPREVKQIIYEIPTLYADVTFIEILEFLTRFIERKNEFDFLNIAHNGDYNNPLKFIELLKKYQLDLFDQNLRDSLGLIDDRSYEEYIGRYILNINCLLKGEKIKNRITGIFEDVDMYFINEFEHNIKFKESAEIFRSHMLTTLGAYSLDNPNKKIVYTDVFPQLVKKLKESFREEQKKVIINIARNIVFYITEKEGGDEPSVSSQVALTEDGRKQILLVLQTLQQQYQYTQSGALTLLKYLIKEKY